MPDVSGIAIKVQSGTTNTYVATWNFEETTRRTVPSSGNINVGDWVRVRPGARWYNGVPISSFVFNEEWQVRQVNGNRAIIDRNRSGTHSIRSPINVADLIGGSGGGGGEIVETTNYLDHYEVKWNYDSGDGIWFNGDSGNTEDKFSTYNGPENSIKIKVSVKPVSKTYTVNNQEVSYWTGGWVSCEYTADHDPPPVPPTPSVEIKKFKLTATIDNINDNHSELNQLMDQIEFEIYDGTKKVNSGVVDVLACMATYSCTVTAGGSYRVRCRAINLIDNTQVYSDYSDFANPVSTIPLPPEKIVDLEALSSTSIYIEWTPVANCDSYTIQYTTDATHFDSSTDVQSTTVQALEEDVPTPHCTLVGLETGKEYFFRVGASNEQGDSSWTDIESVIIGKNPVAPTTWSSSTVVITGEPLTLYWVHNAQDGSRQTHAEVELTVGIGEDTKITTHTENFDTSTPDEDYTPKTSSYAIDTTDYPEGTSIKWRVRTCGVTRVFGDWSVQRTVDIYAPVTLTMEMTDKDGEPINILNTFPFYISALAGPKTQRPIGYHVSVVSDETYETVDNIGKAKFVSTGEEIYSQYFETGEPLLIELNPGNIDLQNNMHYTVTCTVSMNSGLVGTASIQFSVEWEEKLYEPDCEIGIDPDIYAAYISPYCLNKDGTPVTDVLLSVYRREYDGTFTLIADEIEQTKNEYIMDPHPALDYARYRIVAISKTTGAISYYDPPGYPISGKEVVIQWNDEWSNFDTNTSAALEQPPWSGSLLKLPYNIDVSESNSPDVAIVEYIGRTHAVSYYGTQLGTTASWNMDIDKKDKDTLYALRRLQIWMDDVYVREPSGVGYWANVKVSFSQTHAEVTIPVTLEITRVEGGI